MEDLRKRVERYHPNLLTNISLLAVTVLGDRQPSGDGEPGLRARQAVLEGLSGADRPLDGEHIGYVTETWPPPKQSKPSIERGLLIPWEECESVDDPDRVFPRNRRVFLLSLPGREF